MVLLRYTLEHVLVSLQLVKISLFFFFQNLLYYNLGWWRIFPNFNKLWVSESSWSSDVYGKLLCTFFIKVVFSRLLIQTCMIYFSLKRAICNYLDYLFGIRFGWNVYKEHWHPKNKVRIIWDSANSLFGLLKELGKVVIKVRTSQNRLL
jgi:hypothetical protein